MPALMALATLPSLASVTTAGPEEAIAEYCEPLLSGSSAEAVTAIAIADGFEEQLLGAQKVLISGELIVGLSASPRVCFVQAPSQMTLEQGFALADGWAARHQGAVRSAATSGPDGAPVRGWSVPAQRLSLVATQQTAGTGKKVMAFILLPPAPQR